MRKLVKSLMTIVTAILVLAFILFACALDSDSYIPAIVCAVSMGGIAITYATYWKAYC